MGAGAGGGKGPGCQKELSYTVGVSRRRGPLLRHASLTHSKLGLARPS